MSNVSPPYRLQPGAFVLGRLIGANFNITTDQAIPIVMAGPYTRINSIFVTNASISLTTAVGGIYTAASKGGTAIVAAGQVYSALTAATKIVALSISGGQSDQVTGTQLFFALTTPQGAAATADIIILANQIF